MQEKPTNLMGYYVPERGPAYRFFEQLWDDVQEGRDPRFKKRLVENAREEMWDVIRAIDRATYPFNKALTYHIFGGISDMMSVFLIEGNLIQRDGIKERATFPIDITREEPILYRQVSDNETLDDKITIEKTRVALAHSGSALRKRGYVGFEVVRSRVFYASESELERLAEMGDFSFVPYIAETELLRGLESPPVPLWSNYPSGFNADLVSRRDKGYPEGKIMDRLKRNERESIIDLVGTRYVGEEERVKKLSDFFESGGETGCSQMLGKFQVEVLPFGKNRFADPEKSGFQNHKLILRVSGGGPRFVSHIRELQLYTWVAYHQSEINVRSPYHHSRYKEKQNRPARIDGLLGFYLPYLEHVFGHENKGRNIIPIRGK